MQATWAETSHKRAKDALHFQEHGEPGRTKRTVDPAKNDMFYLTTVQIIPDT